MPLVKYYYDSLFYIQIGTCTVAEQEHQNRFVRDPPYEMQR